MNAELPMSKRTIGLIVALFVIAVILLVISLSSAWQKKNSPLPPTEPSPTPYAQSSLIFSPNQLTIPVGAAKQESINIVLTTGADDVTGVQFEIQYDPRVLFNVEIAPGAMFPQPNVILKKINTQTGIISYAYGIQPRQSSQKGSGIVGVLTFTPNPSALDQNGQPITTTTVKLLPKTEVAARGQDYSVLMPSSLSNKLQLTFTK